MTPRLKSLIKKYPYIVAWGQYMQSYGYYIEQQLESADEAKAPADATSYNHRKGVWTTYSDLSKELRAELDEYKNGTKGGVIFGWTELKKE